MGNYDFENSLGPYRDHEAEQAPTKCEHNYQWSKYCCTYVCSKCSDHNLGKDGKGQSLARCFCGWPAGEQLEDDIGVATFDGESWDVDY